MNDVVYAMTATAAGAMLGPLIRYGLGLPPGGDAPTLSVSTLLANVIAAYFVGASAGVLDVLNLPSLWKPALIGALTAGVSAGSAFSAELLARLRDGRLGWSALLLMLHVAGSLVMTLAGLASVSLLRGPG